MKKERKPRMEQLGNRNRMHKGVTREKGANVTRATKTTDRAVTATTKTRVRSASYKYVQGRLFFALTVGSLDVYAVADVDVERAVIHGH